MAWNAPITWTPGQTLTAALLNAQLRDNMLETMPGKVTGANQYLTCTSSGVIQERKIAVDWALTDGTRTSASYGDLSGGGTGPSVTLSTGQNAIVVISCAQVNESADWNEVMSSHAVSGASSIAATDNYCIKTNETNNNTIQASHVMCHDGTLSTGTNTFTMQYRVGTGGNTGRFSKREIMVLPQ